MEMHSLHEFRVRIDELDARIVELLAQRMEICAKVAAFKKAKQMPMMQPARIEQVKTRVAGLAASRGMRSQFMNELYGLIINEACFLERQLMENNPD